MRSTPSSTTSRSTTRGVTAPCNCPRGQLACRIFHAETSTWAQLPSAQRLRYPRSPGGNSSVGRASASQAEGRGFESRFPLHVSSLEPTASLTSRDQVRPICCRLLRVGSTRGGNPCCNAAISSTRLARELRTPVTTERTLKAPDGRRLSRARRSGRRAMI